ncbi:MAG: HpcH/HpaI aldolase/citrate lyase family protein, partial [Woeseia sp.]
LKEAIRNGQPALGLFVKTPSSHLVESLAGSGLGCVVLDAEHAAFGTAELDHCILAGRSIGLPMLVRLREATAAAILQVLDMGAAGIIAPHVHSAEQAVDIVAATRYENGTRGFSGAHRAAVYGAMPADEFKKASDESTIVIAQIEDSLGLKNVDAIAAVDALDALLIGRADLSVSLGAKSIDDDSVVQAVDNILAACRQDGMSAGIYLPTLDECKGFRTKGVNLFFISTDQALLNDAVSALARDFK